MRRQHFVFYCICLSLFCGSVRLFAVGEDFEDKDKPFSHRAEKGLNSEKPSRLTFYGDLETMGLIGSSKAETFDNLVGTKKEVINNALDAQFKSNFGLLWEFTPFTGAHLKLKTFSSDPKDKYSSSVSPSISLSKFVAYSDIAGELGSEYFSTKLSMGIFGFDRESFSVVEVMGTKLSNRHEQSDQLNVQLELGTRNTFPIKLVLASDMDFGINREYNKLNWNNKGSSYLVDLQSADFKIADVMTLGWNVYYGYSRTASDDHHVSTDKDMLENYLNKLKNTVGATVGVSMPIGDLVTISAGAVVEYNSWQFVGSDIPASVVGVLKEQKFGSFEWHVGAKMELKNILTAELAARQDAYNHVEYASLNNEKPNTEFITGLALEYLQLKEIAKLTFHLGVGAGFGSLFSSEEYKRARHGVDTHIYSKYALNDMNKVVIKGIAKPKAGNQFSADLGVGYHPVKGASIYLGYQYGRYGVKTFINNKGSDFKGSPGQVYITAKYKW